MVYFSAHWCPPCRGFTPVLAKWYNKHKDDTGKECEIVFVSSDRNLSEYKTYFKTMPWVSMPFDDKDKDAVGKLFKVTGIPTLVALDVKSNKIINTEARGSIQSKKDPFGS